MKASSFPLIVPSEKRGEKYNQWQTHAQIRKDINAAVRAASSYEEFLFLIKAKGYEIKGEDFGEGAAKYITFRPLDKERPVQGERKDFGKGIHKRTHPCTD